MEAATRKGYVVGDALGSKSCHNEFPCTGVTMKADVAMGQSPVEANLEASLVKRHTQDCDYEVEGNAGGLLLSVSEKNSHTVSEENVTGSKKKKKAEMLPYIEEVKSKRGRTKKADSCYLYYSESSALNNANSGSSISVKKEDLLDAKESNQDRSLTPLPKEMETYRTPKARKSVHRSKPKIFPVLVQPVDLTVSSENGLSGSRDNPLLGKGCKKRGKKSKADLMTVNLAAGLDCTSPQSDPGYVQKLFEEAASDESVVVPPGGRPRRKAARVARLFLHELAEEITDQTAAQNPMIETVIITDTSVKKRGRKKKKISTEAVDDLAKDADFVVPEGLAETEEDVVVNSHLSGGSEPEQEDSLEARPARVILNRKKTMCRGSAANGLHNSIMLPVWKSTEVTKEFRDRLFSTWEFPEWIPNSRDWILQTESESETYLPKEVKSPLFRIKREGIREDQGLHTLDRFQSLPPHRERWDTVLFVGGPVWCMEWCPTPDGSAACQHAAIYCHRGMDDRHQMSRPFAEPGLLQIWKMGRLSQEVRSETQPSFAYGIVIDHGCIWDMKFCPSGAWESPGTSRKVPDMTRLGLLAAAFSDGKVGVYCLPHPESLKDYKSTQVKEAQSAEYPIYKVRCTVLLEVGSVRATSVAPCGQCFCIAWLPSKNHQYLAAGFYDGTVAIWNLVTKSLLQRVRQVDGSVKLYPFRCFTAHDHAVKSIEWCKANRFGLSGIYYIDSGFLGFKPYFAAPRKGTVWSISVSDWLNMCAAGDNTGEVIGILLPDLMLNPMNIKRPSERRFPVYKASLMSLNSSTQSTDSPPNGKSSECVQENGKESNLLDSEQSTYSEAVKKYYILFDDTDMRSFKNFLTREPIKRMQQTDTRGAIFPYRMPLESIHKVRMNPNLDSHGWMLSGGQSGIVRAHCMQSLNTHISRKLIKECQAQFSAMYHFSEIPLGENSGTAVSHSVVQAN
ncbi:general transcription factor 3C polypeptide 2 [Protopterus annectens]|uniref:general transcription factor 3C polypeptide 2 n=1 Tax=Protopterus annectens TaxID=7888 RepID=UPI001CF97718|nr:general transcription factor 3C polypeptide 2 [Protopterus annectens]